MPRRSFRIAGVFGWLAIAMGAATLVLPTGVNAATGERPRILVFASAADAPALARLRAELAIVGFDLRLGEAISWPPSRDQMDELAQRESAVAALALIPQRGRGGTEIWVVDRVTGKTVVRVFEPTVPSNRDELDLLAVSAVETLRATLLEITLPQQAEVEVVAPLAVRELVAPGRDRFRARVASGVGWSPGGLGFSWQVAIGVTRSLRSWCRIGLEGLLPLTSANISGPEGNTDIRLWLAGPLIELSLTEPAARGDIRFAGGVWGVLMQMSGAAAAPYTGTKENVETLAPHLDLTAGWRLTRRVTIDARLSTAIATPAITVRFSGRDAATWGRPFGLGALSLEARLD